MTEIFDNQKDELVKNIKTSYLKIIRKYPNNYFDISNDIRDIIFTANLYKEKYPEDKEIQELCNEIQMCTTNYITKYKEITMKGANNDSKN